MTRARILKAFLWFAGAVAASILALGLWAFVLEPASLTVVRDRIQINGLHTPLKIAVLTDLHVGSPFNGLRKLRRVVSRTNAEQPDLVCILGDLVTQGIAGGGFVPPEEIAVELANLHPRLGAYAVLGNHDNSVDHDRIAKALETNRITVIEDTSRRIDTGSGAIWLAGVSDLWTAKHDIAAALADVAEDGAPVIVMTHHPDIFPEIPNRVSLTLAGHTHGGQVKFPFFGTPIVPSQYDARYVAGHIVENGRQMYVSTGVGTSIIPVRFRVPPAISIVTLVSK